MKKPTKAPVFKNGNPGSGLFLPKKWKRMNKEITNPKNVNIVEIKL